MGIKPRLDAAVVQLSQKLAGAALERYRDPISGKFNRQGSMRLLTGDPNLKGKGPMRVINQILERPQDSEITEEDLERLVGMLHRPGDEAGGSG